MLITDLLKNKLIKIIQDTTALAEVDWTSNKLLIITRYQYNYEKKNISSIKFYYFSDIMFQWSIKNVISLKSIALEILFLCAHKNKLKKYFSAKKVF